MIHNDYAYWKQSNAKWLEMAENALKLGDMDGFNRMLKRADAALMLRDECSGLIYVVSGRKGEGVCRRYDNSPQTA